MTMNDAATRAQDIRDLRREIGNLQASEDQEIVFRETSLPRRKVTLYSMLTGEPVQIPVYLLQATLDKQLPNGASMFTARLNEAPVYKQGAVKCFLHPDSPERALLNDIGLGATYCDAAHLSNLHSRRIHALHRHKMEWAAYQEYIGEQEQKEYREQQRQQLEATLSIARAAGMQAQATEAVKGKRQA